MANTQVISHKCRTLEWKLLLWLSRLNHFSDKMHILFLTWCSQLVVIMISSKIHVLIATNALNISFYENSKNYLKFFAVPVFILIFVIYINWSAFTRLKLYSLFLSRTKKEKKCEHWKAHLFVWTYIWQNFVSKL